MTPNPHPTAPTTPADSAASLRSATLTLAVVGATGAVGCEFARIIEADPHSGTLGRCRIKLLTSQRSAGRTFVVGGREYITEELTDTSLRGVDLAFFSAGGSVSRRYAPAAAAAGTVVIDNSSAFRMDAGIPLVVPEINPQACDAVSLGCGGIVANPNCSTIITAVVIWPIAKAFGVERAVISTYQAVSGAGAAAMAELEQQTRAVLAGRAAEPSVFPEPCAFNVFSHDSPVDEQSGLNVEERKMLGETAKIFRSAEGDVVPPRISCTCIRVPVMRAHSASINLALRKPASAEDVRAVLAEAPGIRVLDDRLAGVFPTPLRAAGGDDVLVGRIRRDQSIEGDRGAGGVDLFVSGDQLRKGAALNAVQIAELLIGD
ncbi:MAG: aspartate-semialdehyde dehydrogenase [Phycisphaerales bacterium]|nr:aspartate-semialdehyde dehydrogenase [Phycisphaerales bacterium]